MEQVFSFLLLLLYSISLFCLGMRILHTWVSKNLPVVFSITASFLLGVGVGIPLTYFLGCLFGGTNEPIRWGMIVVIVLSSWLLVLRWRSRKEQGTMNYELRTNLSDIFLVLFSLIFSTWLMTKTFRGGAGGQIFTGSNNVFDFGFALGIIRSFSWGANIPLESPFFAGLPFFYHFLFPFWAAIQEYSGVPLIWAVNIPSILSFSALLVIVYYIPQLLLKQSKWAGWIAVLLTITHSTMTFWLLLLQKGLSMDFFCGLWTIPTYPFAGPFDGSAISIFTTLNNYVNQRHLAFGVGLGFLLYTLIVLSLSDKKDKKGVYVSVGIIAGIMIWWNIAVFFLTEILIVSTIVLSRKWRGLAWFVCFSFAGLVAVSIPVIPFMGTIFAFLTMQTQKGSAQTQALMQSWNAGGYLWMNLGILPLAAALGYWKLDKTKRLVFLPFVVFFVLQCIGAVIGPRGFDQKFYSFLIIGINMLAAVAVFAIWKKGRLGKIAATVVLFVLTISGFVDLLAVKNEFAFPFLSDHTLPVVTWIHEETPKTAVFVSYADIIDPVVLAGRKNYFGFYGNIGWSDKKESVRRIYEGDMENAKQEGVSYILVPKEKAGDFSYTVNRDELAKKTTVVYEDEKFMIFRIKDE